MQRENTQMRPARSSGPLAPHSAGGLLLSELSDNGGLVFKPPGYGRGVTPSRISFRKAVFDPAWRITAGTIAAGVAAALIVVGALVMGLFAVGVAAFGAVRPTAAPVSARSADAGRFVPHLRAGAPTTAADEAGR